MRKTRWWVLIGCVMGVVSGSEVQAQPALWFVDSQATGADTGDSWTDAFTDLQLAIDAANGRPDDEIWVAAVPNGGFYKPSVPSCAECDDLKFEHATFRIPSQVRVYGGFAGGETAREDRDEVANETILSGDIREPNHPNSFAFHVVTANGTGLGTRLSGFTIKDGDATSGDPNDVFERVGAGLLVVDTADQAAINITRCVFKNNHAYSAGGGIAVYWDFNESEADPVRVVNCTFHINDADSRDTEDPQGIGGGIWMIHANFEITNSVFTSNGARLAGGGAHLDSSLAGGDSVGKLTHDTFFKNQAPNGGAVRVRATYSDPDDPFISINNSICWHDGNPDPENPTFEISGIVDVRYSDVEYFPGELWPSSDNPNRNINEDPQFCDENENHVALTSGSPCIDVGNDSLIPNDTADVNENGSFTELLPWDRAKLLRLFNAIVGGDPDPVVDMGAYEFPFNPNCRSDLDGNGSIGLQDLALLLSEYGQSGLGTCPCVPADIDCDGDVDISDLALLLSDFGTFCTTLFGGGGDSMSGGGESDSSGGEDPDMPSPEFVAWAQQASVEDLLSWRDEWLDGR